MGCNSVLPYCGVYDFSFSVDDCDRRIDYLDGTRDYSDSIRAVSMAIMYSWDNCFISADVDNSCINKYKSGGQVAKAQINFCSSIDVT